MHSRTLVFAAAVALAATVTTPAHGQQASMKELGIDAGLVLGLGDQSSVSIDVPAARARVGFFGGGQSRWSIEPAVGLSYFDTEGSDGGLVYNLEVGALYHFSPPSSLAGLADNRVTVAYARPFINVTGFTGDNGDSEVSMGGGLGVKIPWRSDLAWRMEANLGYGFDNEAFRLGALAGLSFFVR